MRLRLIVKPKRETSSPPPKKTPTGGAAARGLHGSAVAQRASQGEPKLLRLARGRLRPRCPVEPCPRARPAQVSGSSCCLLRVSNCRSQGSRTTVHIPWSAPPPPWLHPHPQPPTCSSVGEYATPRCRTGGVQLVHATCPPAPPQHAIPSQGRGTVSTDILHELPPHHRWFCRCQHAAGRHA